MRTADGRGQAALRGFTYVEVVLAAALLAVLLVPAMHALQAAVAGSPTSSLAGRAPALGAKMEEVLSRPFVDLYADTYKAGGNTAAAKTAYSDAVGDANRRLTAFYRFDPGTKALSTNDTGLLFISVWYEAESVLPVSTLAGRWW